MSNNTDPILIDISNAFYTGNYQQCITISEKVKVKHDYKNSFQLINLFFFKFNLIFLEANFGKRYFHVSFVSGYKSLSCGNG